MELSGRVVVVTGGGRGIGAAMVRRFAQEDPRGLVVGDVDGDLAAEVAREVGGLGVTVDVGREEDNVRLIDAATDRFGPVDLFCANAGYAIEGDEQTPDVEWDRMWRVNFMSHVWAARRLVPEWLARGEGYLLHTASAAGLLTNLFALQYSVTKHAVVALAEWLAVTYGDRGLKVSCLCPQGVNTRLLDADEKIRRLLAPVALEPEEVADRVVEGIENEEFLILPHPEVEGYFQNKANDYQRWLDGMRRLQRRLLE
ncbi:MAG: dehydrogenase [Acidimicrobiia bacterium]|nr:MAG: dehydrogenase [Acidimicrobiia bacterium]